MRRSADTWARLGILLVAVGVPSSCLLTSSFDGLTSDPSAPDAGTSTSSSGEGGASSAVSSAVSGTGTGGAGGAASFPTTSLLDDFDRLDGPLGNGWLIDASLSATLNSHQLVMGGNGDGVILWPKSFGADQEAYFTFEKTNPDDYEIELLLKSQADSGECDALELAYHPPMLMLYSCNSDGSGTQIGEGLTVTFQAGDQLGARALADGKVEAFKNGALIATWNAAGWVHHAKGGRIGLGTYGLKSPNKFDDFGGGALP
jgi:hypothetical protein